MKIFYKLRLILFISLIPFFSGCEKLFFNEDPKDTPTAVFEDVWKGFNEKFALFEFKGVDWNAMKTKYQPYVTDGMSENELAMVLIAMTNELRDPHSGIKLVDEKSFSDEVIKFGAGINKSNLFDDLKRISKYSGAKLPYDDDKSVMYTLWHYTLLYDYDKGEPLSYGRNYTYDLYKTYDTANSSKALGGIVYYTKDNIGYIRIESFESEQFSITDFAQIINEMKDTKGLILDVRPNGGGSPVLATQAAGFFIDKTTKGGTDRYKTGPGKNDFATSELYFSPSELGSYLKPVALLTGRAVFSATTKFVFYLVNAPNVTLIGSKTGGGANAPYNIELANGMQMKIAVSEMIDNEGRHIDDGFSPDQDNGGKVVYYNANGAGKDAVIDEALEFLK